MGLIYKGPSNKTTQIMNKNPSYHVITLQIEAQNQEFIQGILYQNGCMGLEEESTSSTLTTLRCYFDALEPLSVFSPKIIQWVPQAEILQSTTIDLNAIQAMIPTFEPIEIAPDIFIIAPEDVPHKETITTGTTLIIRPGMGFGTGRHETTQLVIQAMLKWGKNVESLADIGSGSGVLAIVGEKLLGLKQIDAIEIDLHARENAIENFELNNTKHIKQGSNIREITNKCYDLVVANIISSTLIFLKKNLISAVKENGYLILSGILETEKEEIINSFSELKLIELTQQKEWICFVFKT